VSAGRRLRTLLLLDAAAIAAIMGVALLGLMLPLSARRSLSPAALGALAVIAGLVATLMGGWLLWRSVARPVDRILEAAGRLASEEGLPLLGEGSGLALSRAAVAFERIAAALEQERRRLAGKVEQLTRAGQALDDAQASLARSERLATVGRLASGLAHEIGNPLGAISGYVEIARSRLPRDADPDLADAVNRIDEATTRIDRTIRGLLDFARPAPPRLAPLAIAESVEAAVRLARVQPRFRQVEVIAALPPGLRVMADGHQLGQVLLNLLLNAGDAMGGTGRVTLTARQEGTAVELTVADEGPGIAPEHLPHLFEPFFTTKEPGEGTGLGLAISHRIVESMGGALTAVSGAPRGAVFALRLPGAAQGA
jgi:C4-dicarboxylate-specific signal transduction histidine kinase